MKYKSRILIIILLIVSMIKVADAQWQQCTQFGHPIGCDNFTSTDSIIYGYNYDNIYKTSNNGQSWDKINKPNNYYTVNKIAAIGNSICIIVLADNLQQSPKLFLSQNKGNTWTYLNDSFPSYTYYNDIIAYNNTYYLSTSNGLFTSSNSGLNWNKNQSLDSGFNAVSVNGNKIFAITDSYNKNVLKKSIDNGNNWVDLRNSLPNYYYISSVLSVGNRLYINLEIWGGGMYYDSIYISNNEGVTWECMRNGLPSNNDNYSSFYTNNDTVYIHNSNNFFYASVNDTIWKPFPLSANGGFFAKDNLRILGANKGHLVSQDYGNTWNPANSGLDITTNITSLNLNANDIYATTSNDGVFKTTDRGLNWTNLNNVLLNNDHYCFLYNIDSLMFSLINDSIKKSSDNGQTWINASNGINCTKINYFAKNGTKLYAVTNCGLYISGDNGHNWIQSSNGLPDTLAKIAFDGNKIYVESLNKGLFVSNNGGLNWNILNSNSKGSRLLVSGNRIITSIENNNDWNFLYSNDYGLNWNIITTPFHLYSFTLYSNIIIASGALYHSHTNDEFYYAISYDEGLTWIQTYSCTILFPIILNDTLYSVCGSEIWKRPMSDFVGIKENTINDNISIYPNPAKENITIETNSNTKQNIEVLNILGQIICKSSVYKKANLDVSDFPKGVYMVKINTDKGMVIKKFVKE